MLYLYHPILVQKDKSALSEGVGGTCITCMCVLPHRLQAHGLSPKDFIRISHAASPCPFTPRIQLIPIMSSTIGFPQVGSNPILFYSLYISSKCV